MQFNFKLHLMLIRALFPRWNFFDQIGYHFELEFKIPNAIYWERISFDVQRSPLGLFFNPQTHLALLEVGLVEHFAMDVQRLSLEGSLVDSKEVQSLTTFNMLKSLLRVKLENYNISASPVQFKIVACHSKEEMDVYISDWIQLEFL